MSDSSAKDAYDALNSLERNLTSTLSEHTANISTATELARNNEKRISNLEETRVVPQNMVELIYYIATNTQVWTFSLITVLVFIVWDLSESRTPKQIIDNVTKMQIEAGTSFNKDE